MTARSMVPLGRLMREGGGSVNPSKFPTELFELYSIPSFDHGKPESVLGSEIGSAKQFVEPGDVLLSKIVPHIRRAWVVGKRNGHRQIASGEWIVFRHNEVVPNYFRYLLTADFFHRQYMQTVAGVGGSLLRARPKHVARIEIPLPTRDEQQCIAAILERADAVRRKRGQALAEIERLVRATFLDLFGELSRNPLGYPVKAIADLVDPERPITYGILMPGPDVTDGVPYIRVTDIQKGRVLVDQVRRTTRKIADEYRRSTLKGGDLLLSIRGHVGRMAFVPDELEGANITQDTARLAIESRVDAIYLRACLESPGFQHMMAQRTKGGAVKGINLGDVRKLEIPMAPKESREAFARAWLHLQDLVEHNRQSLLDSEQLFGSLSQRAFRGEL